MSHDPLHWIDEQLLELDDNALRRRLSVRSSPQRGSSIEFEGRLLANFGSNDYLGLAADTRVIEAAQQAAHTVGWGTGASPLVTGRGRWHAALERALAEFEGTE